MAFSAALADIVLGAYFSGVGATPYVMLHTGSPGAAGTANEAQKPAAAGDIDRKAASYGAPENHPSNTERRTLSDAAVEWDGTEIASGQEITHITVWDADTAGNLLSIFAVTTPKTTGSDGVSIASGELEEAITVFAKPA